MGIINDHLKRNKEALEKYSEIADLFKNKTNIGTAREELISNFLSKNLPEFIKFYSGEIFNHEKKRSGQIDIVVHPITSPKFNIMGSINLFPAETVLAAIEVKSDLTTGKKSALSDALNLSKNVKRLNLLNVNNNFSDTVPFIIFAYKGPTIATLKKQIEKFVTQESIHYGVVPDLIVVLNKGYYLTRQNSWETANSVEDVYKINKNKEEVLYGIFAYLLKLVEEWNANKMPLKEYFEGLSHYPLYDLF